MSIATLSTSWLNEPQGRSQGESRSAKHAGYPSERRAGPPQASSHRSAQHEGTPVSQWNRVNRKALLLLHDESLAEHGGASGLRDEGLLDSALARPLNLALYATPDLAALAAAYGVGLARNHPFIDGNKRATFLAVGMFLARNGFRLNATQVDATLTMLGVAAGDISETDFAIWLRAHVQPV